MGVRRLAKPDRAPVGWGFGGGGSGEETTATQVLHELRQHRALLGVGLQGLDALVGRAVRLAGPDTANVGEAPTAWRSGTDHAVAMPARTAV